MEEEILKYLGIEKVADIAAFKAEFVKKGFLTKEAALKDDDIRKAHFATIYHGVDKVMTDALGSFVDADELKAATKTKDKVELLKKGITAEITKLKGEIESKGDKGEKEKELQGKIDTLNATLVIKETGLKTLHEEKSTLETTFSEERNGWEMKTFKKVLHDKLEFSDSVDEFWKNGFIGTLESKYKLVKEDDKIVIQDAKGQPIANPDKHGETLSPSEVYVSELLEAGKTKKNNVDTTKKVEVRNDHNRKDGDAPKAFVHPDAMPKT